MPRDDRPAAFPALRLAQCCFVNAPAHTSLRVPELFQNNTRGINPAKPDLHVATGSMNRLIALDGPGG